MNDPALATLRAYCAAICPGLEGDATAGAADIAAERYVAHYLAPATLERILEALDRDGRFVSLRESEQLERIGKLRFDAGTRRDLDAAAALTFLAVYGSWSGRDPDGSLARPPLGWELTGYTGHPRSKLDQLGV